MLLSNQQDKPFLSQTNVIKVYFHDNQIIFHTIDNKNVITIIDVYLAKINIIKSNSSFSS